MTSRSRPRTISEVTRQIEEQLDTARVESETPPMERAEPVAQDWPAAAEAIEEAEAPAAPAETEAPAEKKVRRPRKPREPKGGAIPTAYRSKAEILASEQALAAKLKAVEASSSEALAKSCEFAARTTFRSGFAVWGRFARRADIPLTDQEAQTLGEAWGPIIAMHADQIGAYVPYLGALSVLGEIVSARFVGPKQEEGDDDDAS